MAERPHEISYTRTLTGISRHERSEISKSAGLLLVAVTYLHRTRAALYTDRGGEHSGMRARDETYSLSPFIWGLGARL